MVLFYELNKQQQQQQQPGVYPILVTAIFSSDPTLFTELYQWE